MANVIASAQVTAVPRFRAHARRKVRLRGVLWHPRAGWQREAEVANLGLGGACVRLMETLIVGDKVTLSLVTPTLWDPLGVPGRIAWVGPATRLEPGRAGVAFEPTDAAAVFALFEMLGALQYED
jgi:hypothetical protein